MSPQQGQWQRVSRREPCGICEKPDWCTRGEFGWCCMRVESRKTLANGGWFHPFETSKPFSKSSPPPRPSPKPPEPAPDFGWLMREYAARNRPELDEQAAALGLDVQALLWLGAAWAHDRQALAIPMHDATHHNDSKPIGIRLRTPEGRKFAVEGSRNGIFLPYGALRTISPFARMLICEGPTDTAAALHLGYFAIGRSSCRGGEDIVLSVVRQLEPDSIVIVSDNDGPGIVGARILLEKIKSPKSPAMLFVPPGKDFRKYVVSGATRALLEATLKDLSPQS